MPGDPDELRAQPLALASLLGARLVSLGMTKHAEHLRRYYAAVRAGREARSGEWSHEQVIRAQDCGSRKTTRLSHGVYLEAKWG